MGQNWLASGSYDKTVAFWNISTGVMIRQGYFHQSEVVALELLSTGIVISGGLDGHIAMWVPFTEDMDYLSSVHENGVYCLKADPRG